MSSSTVVPSVRSDLITFGGWSFLAGVFLMVTGDGITNYNEPVAALAWPWLYLVPLAISLVVMTAAGCIGPHRRTRVAPVFVPLTLLLVSFAISTFFSQERTLSVPALGAVAGIVAFWLFAAQMVEDSRRAEATWLVATFAVLELAIRVVVWRLDEGLNQIPLQISSVNWLGKLQLAWVFNLFAPFLLARFIAEPRPWLSLFSGVVWAAAGLANYLLLSRMGSLIFLLSTVAVCLLNLAYWRRWIVLMSAAVVAGAFVVANNLQVTSFVISTFLDRSQNPGIDLRLRVWEEAWQMFQTHPIVGVGLGTFDEVAYRMPGTQATLDFRQQGWHAHNVPLHILTETGVLGLAAWVFLWYVVLRALIPAWTSGTREQRAFSAAALVSVLAFHLLSMTEVLIGARVHASLQMNLTIALLVVLGLRMSLPQPAPVRQ